MTSYIYKVLSSVISNRLPEYAEKVTGKYQNVFRKKFGKTQFYIYIYIYIYIYTYV